ncbi:MAG: hypothetical protein ABI856_16425 [Nitrospira sp.]
MLSLAHLAGLFSTAQIRSTDFLLASRTGEQALAMVIVGLDQRSYRELLPTHGAMAKRRLRPASHKSSMSSCVRPRRSSAVCRYCCKPMTPHSPPLHSPP